jgi:hypothetical protein
MSEEWIRRLAEELGVEDPSIEESNKLLAAARDVAHGVERRITPLAAFVLGAGVERRMAAGTPRDQALTESLTKLDALIPDTEPGEVP